jgi:type I restriction enzyme, S subunit
VAGDWPLLTIAECASHEPYSTQIGPFGEKIRADNYAPTGAPVLRGTNVNPDGRFHDDDFVFIDSELAETEFGKFVCEADDVILCHKGTLGKIGVIPKKSRFKKYVMGNSMMKVRCDRSKLEPLYLYYWLCSRDGQDYIFSRVSQVGVPQIQRPLSTLREAVLPVPSLAEQQVIVAVLGALDDKIELNRRMNATLEAMARALFQSWFMDFDPVRAKLDGRPPAALGLATAAFFPDSYQDSPLGHIPKGWDVKTVDEVCTVGIGKTPPRMEHHWFSENPADLPWVSIRDLGIAGVFISHTSEFLTAEAVEKFRVKRIPDNTVVLSFKLTMGRVAITDGEMLSNEAIAHFRLNPDTTFGPEYLYCYLKGFSYDQLGSTSSIATAINSDMVRGMRVLVPPKAIAEAFEHLVKPLFGQIKNIQKQSHTLATLRDTLLPKLLSGELSVATDPS